MAAASDNVESRNVDICPLTGPEEAEEGVEGKWGESLKKPRAGMDLGEPPDPCFRTSPPLRPKALILEAPLVTNQLV